MRRAVVHSLLIAGLAGLGWAIQLTANYPHGVPWAQTVAEADFLGPWRWIPAVVGCAGLAVCAAASFFAAGSRTAMLPALLIAPGLCLVLSAVGYHIVIRQLMGDFGSSDVLPLGYLPATKWLAGRAFFAQVLLARGAFWAWLGFGAAALAAGCTPTVQRPHKDSLRWAWPAATALAILVSVGVWVLGYAGLFYNFIHARDLGLKLDLVQTLQYLCVPRALLFQLPLLVCLAVLGALTLTLLPLRPRVQEIGEALPPDVASARSTAGIALLGAGLFLGLSHWLYWSARCLLMTYTAIDASSAEAKQALFVQWGTFSTRSAYVAGVPVGLALTLVAIVAAAPLLLTSVRSWQRWVAPSFLLVASALAFVGIRAMTIPLVEAEVRPQCEHECTELDRVGALVVLAPLQHGGQIIRDRCGSDLVTYEREDLALPRVLADQCPVISALIEIRRGEIVVNRSPVNPVDESQRGKISCDPAILRRVEEAIEASLDDERALAARNPNQPCRGRLLIVADESTPAGLMDCILSIAYEVGYHDLRLLVARPAPHFPQLLRTVGLHAVPELAPPDGSPIWSLRLSPSEAVLVSPSGQTWAAPSADLLVNDARVALAIQRGSPMLWVHRSDDLPLQADLDARAALTAPGLFVEAWAPPLGAAEEPAQPAVLERQ